MIQEHVARRRTRKRSARLIIFLPILVLVLLIVVGYYNSTQPGTLVVEAIVRNTNRTLSVQAHLSGKSITTPASIRLPQGTYNVTYSAIQWYRTPTWKYISLLSGHTAYAIGEYSPTPDVIQMTSGGFNVTAEKAKQGVTPVVWVNGSAGLLVLMGDVFDRAVLAPNQNFTYFYKDTGHFRYWIEGTSANGYVDVSG